VGIFFEYDEVEASLTLLEKGFDQTLQTGDWIRLFETRGYRLLKKRELNMGNAFNDEDFQIFIKSLINTKTVGSYQLTFERFQAIDLNGIQQKVMAYLPKHATFNTTIIPIIKSQKNSFVHQMEGESCLFIYLAPACLKAKLENTLIHELHHIGLDSVYDPSKYSGLETKTQKLIEWTNAFGEGFAMLAAAGGPQNHPVPFDEQNRRVWNENSRHVEIDFEKIQCFLIHILEGQFEDEQALIAKGMELMMNNGGQGSWYTVGWKISIIIEEIFGRQTLIDCMEDLRKLYIHYNKGVKVYNSKYGLSLPSWHDKIINRVC